MFINIQSISIFKHQYITEYYKDYVYQNDLYRATRSLQYNFN